MTIRPWHGTFEDSAVQVRHDGTELRVLAGGEDAARIAGDPRHLRTLLTQAVARLDEIVAEQDAAGDDDEPAVCAYCDMALEWWGPAEGWVALRYVRDGDPERDEPDTIDEPVHVCPFRDGFENTHRPLTPAEREQHTGDDGCGRCRAESARECVCENVPDEE